MRALLVLLALPACTPAVDGDPLAAEPVDSAVDLAACDDALDCDDGDPCTGVETCGDDGACLPGEPFTCGEHEVCVADGDAAACACAPGFTELDGTCATACPVPVAPVLARLTPDDTLVFEAPNGPAGTIELATLAADAPSDDPPWTVADTLPLAGLSGDVRVLARIVDDACLTVDRFDHVYAIGPALGPVAGVPRDRPGLRWATSVVDYAPGLEVSAPWQDCALALGPAAGTSADVCSLGRGGALTLGFDPPIADGDGPDLAVFENGFGTFLELAHVEVSSDGVTFARFDAAAHREAPVGPFEEQDPARFAGLAGLHPQGTGTPFDLTLLRHHPAVRSGRIDLGAITQVRLVDVVGDGSDTDAFGRPLYDPFPTTGSAGFDVDAVGAVGPR